MFVESRLLINIKRDKILIKHLSQVCTELPDGGKNMKCFQCGLMKLHTACLQASDVGVYTCISTNSLGKSDGTIRFYGEIQYIMSICLYLIRSVVG